MDSSAYILYVLFQLDYKLYSYQRYNITYREYYNSIIVLIHGEIIVKCKYILHNKISYVPIGAWLQGNMYIFQ